MAKTPLWKTLAAVGHELIRQPISRPLDTSELEAKIDNLARQIQRLQNFWNRLAMGLATGIGTALGASVIATLIILLLIPIFKLVGITLDLPGRG